MMVGHTIRHFRWWALDFYSPPYILLIQMREYISNQVNKLRTDKDVTQEELAEKLQVSRQTIIAIEKGNYTPSILLALKISKFFNLPIEKIFKISYEK